MSDPSSRWWSLIRFRTRTENALPSKTGKPYSTRFNYGEEFLPFDAYALVFVKLHMRRPPALKQFPIKISPKTDSIVSIGIQPHVWGRGNGRVEEKEMPIPTSKEGFPHIKVLEKFFVKMDEMETVVYAPGKVDHTLQKVLPGTTALQVNCRVPISDWSSIKRTEPRPVK